VNQVLSEELNRRRCQLIIFLILFTEELNRRRCYLNVTLKNFTGLMLWATALKVTHPKNGETLRFCSRPPAAKFDSFLAREQQRWDKLHHKPLEREGER
jgi:hypothetical protein